MVNQDKPNGQEQSPKKLRVIILVLWLFVAVFLVGLYLYSQLRSAPNPCPGDLVVPGSEKLGGAFELLDETGAVVEKSEIVTGPSLIYFGYSFCPDVCPIDTTRNAEVTDILKTRGITLTPIMITVDPERDTPEVMAEYVSYIHEDMRGLSGSLEQIENAKSAYNVYGQKQESDDRDYYLVDHSAFSYFETPTGFQAVYSRAQSAEEIANNIQCKIEHLDE